MSEQAKDESGYEAQAIHSKGILVTISIFATMILIALVTVGASFGFSNVPLLKYVRYPLREISYPRPQLLSDPVAALNRRREKWHSRISDYGWQDRKAAIVRIPIGRAMEIVAGLGDKAYGPVATGKTSSGGGNSNGSGGAGGSSSGDNSQSGGNNK